MICNTLRKVNLFVFRQGCAGPFASKKCIPDGLFRCRDALRMIKYQIHRSTSQNLSRKPDQMIMRALSADGSMA